MDVCKPIDLRRSNLTAIQILAAIGVLFSHSYRIGTGGVEPLSGFTHGQCTCGTVSVAIFLFLSGFLVVRSYPAAGSPGWKARIGCLFTFAARRLTRIFPTVAFAILACAFCLGPLASRLPVREYFAHPLTWRYLQGLGLHAYRAALPGVFEGNVLKSSVNGSLWVIPWQMWCYWMLALLGVSGLHKNRRAMLIACSFAWALFFGRGTWLAGMPWPGGISPVQGIRLVAFFFTGCLASLHFDKTRLDGRLALGLACSLPLWLRTPAGDLALGTAGAYVLLYLVFAHPVAMLQHLPPISFGIFVLGFPVQQVLALFWGKAGMPWMANFLLSTLVAIPLALLEYRLVEKPVSALRGKLFRGIKL